MNYKLLCKCFKIITKKVYCEQWNNFKYCRVCETDLDKQYYYEIYMFGCWYFNLCEKCAKEK